MPPEEMLERARKRVDNTWKVLTWSIGLYAVISMAVTGFAVSKTLELGDNIHALELRLTQIEGNRFTSQDYAKLIEMLYRFEKKLPESFPPRSFERRVEKIEATLEKISEELHDLERRK